MTVTQWVIIGFIGQALFGPDLLSNGLFQKNEAKVPFRWLSGIAALVAQLFF